MTTSLFWSPFARQTLVTMVLLSVAAAMSATNIRVASTSSVGVSARPITGITPSVVVDSARGRVYVVSESAADQRRPYLFICALDGTDCESHAVAPLALGYGTGNTPDIFLDEPRQRVVIATSNSAAGGKVALFLCSLNGTHCVHRDASASQGANSAYNPRVVVYGTTIYIAAENPLQNYQAWLYKCDLEGLTCTNVALSASIDTGFSPSIAIDTRDSKLLVATRTRTYELLLHRCELSGAPCDDILLDSSDNRDPRMVISPDSERIYVLAKQVTTSTVVRIVTCFANGTMCDSYSFSEPPTTIGDLLLHGTQLQVVTTGIEGQPYLTTIDLPGFTSTTRHIGGTQPDLSAMFPRLGVLDAEVPKLYVATQNDAEALKPWLFITSPFDANTSFVEQPPQLVVGATNTWSLSIRGADGAVVPTPSNYNFSDDTEILLTADGVAVPVTTALGPANASLAIAAPINRLSLHVLSVRVHGAHVPGSPFTYDDTLNPSQCVLENAPPDGAFVLKKDTLYTYLLRLRAASGAEPVLAPSSDIALSHLDVSMGSSSVNLTITPVAPGRTDVVLRFSSDSQSADVFVFSITVDRSPIPGSPFSLSFPLRCDPGFHIEEGACVPCDPGSYANATTTVAVPCTPCAEEMSSPVAATSFLNCTCPVDTWYGSDTRTPSAPCRPCPAGGVCAGGTTYPVADVGFFPITPGAFSYVACVRRGCIGNGTCGVGYEGYMCSGCSEGYFSKSEAECARCPSLADGLLGMAIAGFFLVSVAVAVALAVSASRVANLHHAKTGSGTDQSAIIAFRARTMPVTLSMILLAFQVLGIFAQANFHWSSDSRRVLNIFSVFNVDFQTFGAECSLASFHTLYALSIAALSLFIAVVASFLVVLKAIQQRFSLAFISGLAHVGTRTLLDQALFTLVPLLYIPISKASLVLFDCSRLPDGSIVLDADNGVPCFDSKWFTVLPFGLIVVVVFVCGMPAYFAYTVWVRRHTLFEDSVSSRFGSLYRNYRQRFYWAEIADLGRRLAIVVTAIFFSKHQLAQFGFLFVILGASVLWVSTAAPYYVPLYNRVDVRLVLLVLGVLALGMGSYAERGTASSDTFFLAATLVVVIALVAVSVHSLVMDLISIRKERTTQFSAAIERSSRLMDVISTELKDVEAGPVLLRAAGEFLATLDNTVRLKEHDNARRASQRVSIALDPLTPP